LLILSVLFATWNTKFKSHEKCVYVFDPTRKANCNYQSFTIHRFHKFLWFLWFAVRAIVACCRHTSLLYTAYSNCCTYKLGYFSTIIAMLSTHGHHLCSKFWDAPTMCYFHATKCNWKFVNSSHNFFSSCFYNNSFVCIVSYSP
jgi:hypothetical protein